MKNLPNKIPNRITYKKTTTTELVDSKTPITRTRSPIRMVHTSQSVRNPEIALDPEFLQTAALAQQRAFSKRTEHRDWSELGAELKCSAADHLMQNEASRINLDMQKPLKYGEALQLVKIIEAKQAFDPLDEDEDVLQMLQIQENAEKMQVDSIDEFEMYALSFDAVIDYLQGQNNSSLAKSLVSLKQYFLQKTASKPTQLKAMESAMLSLDQQNLQQQKDYQILQNQYNQNKHLLNLELEKAVRSAKYQDQLREVIALSEHDKAEQARDLITANMRIQVMDREIKQTSQLLNDALSRCKRLSYASQKLKTAAEKASERYTTAERQLVYEQKARIQADQKKQEFEVQANRYLKEYESMVKSFEDEQRRNEIERAKLYTKITNLQSDRNFGNIADQGQFAKTVQKACQTLLGLSRIDQAQLESNYGVDYEGIGGIIYILNTIKNVDSVQKFLDAMGKEIQFGVNFSCQASFNTVVDPRMIEKQLKIQENLLKLQRGNQISRQESQINVNSGVQQDIFSIGQGNQKTESAGNQGGKNADNVIQNDKVLIGYKCDEEDSDDPLLAKEKYKYEQITNKNGQVEYQKVKNKKYIQSQEDEQNKERKKMARKQQLELQKLMRQQINTSQNGKEQSSLLDVLQTNFQQQEDSSASEISNPDMVIEPEKFAQMTEKEQKDFIATYSIYQKERKIRKQDEIKAKIQEREIVKQQANLFGYKDKQGKPVITNDNEDMFGVGFLGDQYKDHNKKKEQNINNKVEIDSITLKQKVIVQARKSVHNQPRKSSILKTKPDINQNKDELLQNLNDLTMDDHMSVDSFSSYTTEQQKDLKSKSPKEQLTNSFNNVEIPVINKYGTQVVSVSIQVDFVQINKQSLAQRLSTLQQNGKPDKENNEFVLEQLQMYIKSNPDMSQKELESIAHISNSYVTHKSNQKQQGYLVADTLKTLQQSVISSQFLNPNKQLLQEELQKSKNFQIIHELIQDSIQKQGYQIDQDTFYKTNNFDKQIGQCSLSSNQIYPQGQLKTSVSVDQSVISSNFQVVNQQKIHPLSISQEELADYNIQSITEQILNGQQPLKNAILINVYDDAKNIIGVVNLATYNFNPTQIYEKLLIKNSDTAIQDNKRDSLKNSLTLASDLEIDQNDLDIKDLETKILLQQNKIADLDNQPNQQQLEFENIKQSESIKTNITAYIDKLKSSMFKDSQQDGVLASLTKARQEVAKQEYFGESKKSIIALFETKHKLKPITMDEIEDLEDALEDTSQKQKEKFINQAFETQNAAKNNLNSMINQNNRYKHLIQEQDIIIQDRQKYEDFVSFLNQKSLDDQYQIVPSTHLPHPIYGNFDFQFLDVVNIFDESNFQINNFSQSIKQQFGFVQESNSIQFYPTLITRGTNIKNWFKQIVIDESKQDMINITFKVLKNEISEYETQKIDQMKFQICSKSLLPHTGDLIDYIKLSSINQKDQYLPYIFQLLETAQNLVFQRISIQNQNYIKIPIFNNQLKSLSWTIKTIRMILYERQFSTLSFIVQTIPEPPIMSSNIDLTVTSDEFQIVSGQLQLQQAISLSSFTFSFFKNRYGIQNIVNQLIIQLITAISHYQFINQEIHIFAKFFFDQLSVDFFYLYLDIRKAVKIDVLGNKAIQNEISDLQFNKQFIYPLVHAIFPNWDSKRKFVLSEQLLQQEEHQTSIVQLQSPVLKQNKPNQNLLSLSKVSSIIFSQYSITRKIAYQNSVFLMKNFNKNQEFIETSHLRQFLEALSLNLNPKEFIQQQIDFEQFKQLFVTYQFGRFSLFSMQLLQGILSDKSITTTETVQKCTNNLNICFNIMRKQSTKPQLEIKFELINKWFQVVNSDLKSFDYSRGINNLVKIGIEILKFLDAGEIDCQVGVLQVIIEVVKEKIGY